MMIRSVVCPLSPPIRESYQNTARDTPGLAYREQVTLGRGEPGAVILRRQQVPVGVGRHRERGVTKSGLRLRKRAM
jgi:hypothetical protein